MVVETTTPQRPKQLDNEPEFESSSVYSDLDNQDVDSDDNRSTDSDENNKRVILQEINNQINENEKKLQSLRKQIAEEEKKLQRVEKKVNKKEKKKIKPIDSYELRRAREKKFCRIAIGIAWLEALCVAMVVTIYSIIAFVIFPDEIGDKMAYATGEQLDGGYFVSNVFGGICWVIWYIVFISLGVIKIRVDDDPENGRDILIMHVLPAAGNIVYHVIRWPVLALMLVYAVDDRVINNSLVGCAFWLDSIIIVGGGIIVFVVWITASECCD